MEATTTADDTTETKQTTNESSGVYVYTAADAKYYHAVKSCDRCPNEATRTLIEKAVAAGKTACPTCASTAKDTVWAVSGEKYYHKNAEHAGTGAVKGTMQEALMHGLKACSTCYSKTGNSSDDLVNTHTYTSGKSGINVYATVAGKYYHTSPNCKKISGSPTYITLENALNYGKTACSSCSSHAKKKVYATKGGKYYHYDSTCAGINASSDTLDVALAYGFVACPHCVSGTMTSSNTYKVGKSGIKVYGSISNKYFHSKSSCSGMTEPTYITLETALNYGKTPCPVCYDTMNKTVYCTSEGKYYHLDASCAGTGASKTSLAKALARGKTACKVCVTGENSKDSEKDDGEGGGIWDDDDGDDIYASADTKVYVDYSGRTSQKIYHKKKSCSDTKVSGASEVTLEFALNQGMTACCYCGAPTKMYTTEE